MATRFETLAIVGLLEVGDGRLISETMSAAADALADLEADAPMDDTVEAGSVKLVRLAAGVGRRSAEFAETCAEATQPPRGH